MAFVSILLLRGYDSVTKSYEYFLKMHWSGEILRNRHVCSLSKSKYNCVLKIKFCKRSKEICLKKDCKNDLQNVLNFTTVTKQEVT